MATRSFVTATTAARLPDLTRYLQAIERRLAKLAHNPARDQDWMARVGAVTQAYRELCAELGEQAGEHPELTAIRWMIEEFRVSLFAQELRTPYPVSEQRIYRAMDDVDAVTPR